MYNDSNVTSDSVSSLVNILPIILFIGLFIRLYYWITGKDIDNNWDLDEETIPEEVLKMRYARGEIDSYEYTERMSRL